MSAVVRSRRSPRLLPAENTAGSSARCSPVATAMAQHVHVAFLLVASLAVHEGGADSAYDIVFSTSHVNFTWASAQGAYASAVADGSYIVENNAITGVKVWGSTIFLTVPRWRTGVPSTLNKWTSSGLLQPFPSWQFNKIGDCNALQYVQSMEIDADRREMWVVDVGRMLVRDSNTDGMLMCALADPRLCPHRS